jgi:hypothetical protein
LQFAKAVRRQNERAITTAWRRIDQACAEAAELLFFSARSLDPGLHSEEAATRHSVELEAVDRHQPSQA